MSTDLCALLSGFVNRTNYDFILRLPGLSITYMNEPYKFVSQVNIKVNEPTAWCSVFLEVKIVTQTIKVTTCFEGLRKFIKRES